MTTANIAMQHRFIQPLDVLFLRGNKLFGDAGSHGESMIPPWPSVAAGALRTALLAHAGVDLAAFAAGKVNHPQLGTPAQPGNWRIGQFQLARRTEQGCEAIYPMPCDVVVGGEKNAPVITPMSAQALPAQLACSAPLPQVPVLAQNAERTKPLDGYWLAQAGWQAYLAGQTIRQEHLLHNSDLWKMDSHAQTAGSFWWRIYIPSPGGSRDE